MATPQYNFQDIILASYELKELKRFEKAPILEKCFTSILVDYGLVDKRETLILPDGTPDENGPCYIFPLRHGQTLS